MRIEEASKPVAEQSNPTFLITMRNEDRTTITPATLTWDLSAIDGTVIALNQSETPGNPTVITLTTAQTRFLQGETIKAERLLSIYATYNSDYGIGLVARKQLRFTIEQFTMIGYPLSIEVFDLILTDDYPRDVGVV